MGMGNHVRVEIDRICMESESDSIFYHILTWKRNSNMNTDSDILEYECKIDNSDRYSHLDILEYEQHFKEQHIVKSKAHSLNKTEVH